MNLRQKRVNSYIMRIVPEIIERELKDPRIGFVTITSVETTLDLRHATVYFTVHGGEEVGELNSKILNHASGFIQHELAKRMKIKNTPKLTFKYNPMKYIDVEKLLKEESEGEIEELGRSNGNNKKE